MPHPDEKYRKRLIERYTNGQASEDEIKALFSLIGTEPFDRLLEDDMDQEIRRIQSAENGGAGQTSNRFRWFVAASVMLLISVGLYFVFSGGETHAVRSASHDIRPGGNRATLTLGNGSQILLDHAEEGEIAFESGVRIRKDGEGQLIYEVKEVMAHSEGARATFNTIETPVGGQYQVVLPDGTNVWLNAGSSLKYPAVFSPDSRMVEMTGEAYFEVAELRKPVKGAKAADGALKVPFLVKAGRQIVEVLGTQFNINAYADEPAVKTTLIEGAVRVNIPGEGARATLRPGQQAVLFNNRITVGDVSLPQAVAWKNGSFIFDDQDFKTVMRQISRWYGVEVVYENAPDDFRIGGDVSRSNKLSVVLQAMELTGKVKFRIEGRRVVVTR